METTMVVMLEIFILFVTFVCGARYGSRKSAQNAIKQMEEAFPEFWQPQRAPETGGTKPPASK